MNATTHLVDFETGIIGAGFAGLGMAIRLVKEKRNSFVVFERAGEVGGTWRDNIYPGCACDVPSYLYSFSYEPNPDWSRMYSPQEEIWKYMKKCVDKYGLKDKIKYHTEIIHCEFETETACWKLTDRNGETYSVKNLVCGLGPLNRPSLPSIPGMEKFEGKTMHSSGWDGSYDFKGKNVAIIGTGASAIQIVPELAKEAAKLDVYQRTPPWIVPKPDRRIGNFEKFLNRYLPFIQRQHRHLIYWLNELKGLAFMGNQTLSEMGTKNALKHIKKSIKDPELQKKVTPHYKMGCKRVLISNDYYPALQKANVELITDNLVSIGAHSLKEATGKERETDVIVYCTGFLASEFICEMKIKGLQGRELLEEWLNKGAEAYYGITVSGFPNLFFLVGPNTGLGHNSIIHMIESQVNYVMDCFQIIENKNSNGYLDLKPEVQEKFNALLQEKLKPTVWNSGCKSWYLNSVGKNTTIWPALTVSYRKQTKKANPEDYQYVAVSALKSKTTA